MLVDRRHPGRAVFGWASQLMSRGLSLFVFPEGTRSRDGRVAPFKGGSFFLALEAGLPIVPLSVIGSRHVMLKGRLATYPGTVKLVIHNRSDDGSRSSHARFPLPNASGRYSRLMRKATVTFSLAPELAAIVRPGVLWIDDATVIEGDPRLDAPLAAAEAAVREIFRLKPEATDTSGFHLQVEEIRTMYKRVGLDPTKRRPSSEAL